MQQPNPLMLYGSLDSQVMALQTELSRERNNEIKIMNMAAEKEQEMQQVNQTLARTLALERSQAAQMRQLQEQLANSTVEREDLKSDLDELIQKVDQQSQQLNG